MTLLQHDYVADLARQIEPEYRFDDQWVDRPAEWRRRWADQLSRLSAPWPTPVAPEPAWRQVAMRDRYALWRVDYTTTAGLQTFALVGVPHELERPAPGVLCVHGHGPLGAYPLLDYGGMPGLEDQVARHQYDFAHRITEQGAATLSPNLLGFGDRLSDGERLNAKRDPCDATFFQQMWMGAVAITSQLHELRVATDLLSGMDAVDSDALGCAGLSYGGRLTTYHAALDERVKAAVVSGAMQSIVDLIGRNRSCGQQVVPGQLQYGDLAEVLGLIAPRALAIELGAKDELCPVTWRETNSAESRRSTMHFRRAGSFRSSSLAADTCLTVACRSPGSSTSSPRPEGSDKWTAHDRILC